MTQAARAAANTPFRSSIMELLNRAAMSNTRPQALAIFEKRPADDFTREPVVGFKAKERKVKLPPLSAEEASYLIAAEEFTKDSDRDADLQARNYARRMLHIEVARSSKEKRDLKRWSEGDMNQHEEMRMRNEWRVPVFEEEEDSGEEGEGDQAQRVPKTERAMTRHEAACLLANANAELKQLNEARRLSANRSTAKRRDAAATRKRLSAISKEAREPLPTSTPTLPKMRRPATRFSIDEVISEMKAQGLAADVKDGANEEGTSAVRLSKKKKTRLSKKKKLLCALREMGVISDKRSEPATRRNEDDAHLLELPLDARVAINQCAKAAKKAEKGKHFSLFDDF